MSASSDPDTSTTTMVVRNAIKKQIDDMMVTQKVPYCEETKFFPPGCINEIAKRSNIEKYICEDIGYEWGVKDREEFVETVTAKAPKIFVAVAKNTLEWGLLYQLVVVGKSTDLYIRPLPLTVNFRVRCELMGQLRKEMTIFGVQPIKNGHFDQELERRFLPITSADRIYGTGEIIPGAPDRWDVKLHKDYWNEADGGLEFFMISLDERPEDVDNAIAGFYSRDENDLRYWLLFPKGFRPEPGRFTAWK